MAGIKISQLDSGGSITSTDQLPVARDGSTTYRIPASQFVVDGVNAGSGSAQIFSDKTTAAGTALRFRSLAGEDNVTLRTSGDTIYISTSGQNPAKTAFVGNGSTTTWAINEAKSVNPNNYRVTIDGVVQEPNIDYTISLTDSTITFTSAPPLSGNVAVISNNLVRAYDIIPSDGSVTTNKLALSSVTTATINNGAITTEKINTGAVTNARLAYDGGAFSFRNKLINGDMRIDQRNAGAVSTNILANYTYSVDRWTIGSSGSATTSQRITDPTTGLYSLRITGATGNTSISFNQRIESQNSLELVNKVVNLSFDSFASTNTTLQWIIQYPTATDNWSSDGLGTTIASGSVNVTTTRTTFNTGPISLDTNVSKGLLVRFVVLNHTSGRTINLTNVQLEVGPTATPFEYRPIGTELALCQRYFEIVGSNSAMRAVGATNIQGCAVIRVPKRTTLTNSNISLTTTSPECAEVSVAYRQATNATVAIQAGNTLSDVRITGFSGLTNGNLCTLYSDVIRVDTEL